MTSPVFRPSAPVSPTWAPSGGWYGAGAASTVPPVAVQPAPAPAASGSNDTARYDAYLSEIQQQIQPVLAALKAGAGADTKYKYDALKAQYDDAKKARDNAYKIVQLQSETSRYGTDASREVQLKQLQEQQRQYDQNHGLEMSKFGLDKERFSFDKERFGQEFGLSQAGVTGTYNGAPTEAARQFDLTTAEGRRQYDESLRQRQVEFGANYGLSRADAIAKYSSTPDQMFMRSDLMSALGAAEGGYGPQPYGASGDPRAKTTADFDAISGPPGSFGSGSGDPSMGMIRPHGPIDQQGNPIAPGGGAAPAPPLDSNSPQYRAIQARLAGGQITSEQASAEWARLTSAPGAPVYAGGTPGFNEGPGQGMAGSVGQAADGSMMSLRGGGAIGVSEGPQWQDYAALRGFGSVPAVAAGRTMAQPVAGMPQQQAAGGADPRIKAARAVVDAIPPSDGDGHDDNDYAALQAIQGIFKARKPGTLARMRPGQQAAFSAGLSRSGLYAPDAIADMERANPGQRSVRMA